MTFAEIAKDCPARNEHGQCKAQHNAESGQYGYCMVELCHSWHFHRAILQAIHQAQPVEYREFK